MLINRELIKLITYTDYFVAVKKYKEELLSTDMERCLVLLSKNEERGREKKKLGRLHTNFLIVFIFGRRGRDFKYFICYTD